MMEETCTPYKRDGKRAAVRMRDLGQLFITGAVQVFFVAVNTYFLSRAMYIGVIVAAFMISFIWTWNVRKVVFGTTLDRVVYSLGATAGSVLGLWVSSFVANNITNLK